MDEIKFSYDDREYTLTFDRDTANKTAMSGLDIGKLSGEQIMSGPRLLFEGSLQKHHGRLSKRLAEEIFDSFDDKQELIAALLEMYAKAVESVYSDGSGKTQWRVSGK